MRTPLLGLLAVAVLLPLASCKLLKKGGDVDVDAAAAATAAAAAPAADDTGSAAPSASAAAPSGPLTFTTACVDPAADAKKRYDTAQDVKDVDLDGDGQKDKIIHAVFGGMNDPYSVYVMRGKCGHLVYDTPTSSGLDVTKLRSHGLLSMDMNIKNCGMIPDCNCADSVDHLFFNGAKYVSGKQVKVYPFGPCDAAAPAASVATTSGYKLGDHISVDWKGKVYPAKIIAVPSKDQYKIHYDGYESSWDEVVGPSRIKGKL